MNCVINSLSSTQSVSGSREYYFVFVVAVVGIDMNTFVRREKEQGIVLKGENSFEEKIEDGAIEDNKNSALEKATVSGFCFKRRNMSLTGEKEMRMVVDIDSETCKYFT